MGRLLIPLLNMMRLRSGPQDLPVGRGSTMVLVALYLSGGFIAGAVLNEPEFTERALVAVGMQFAIIIVLLNLKGFGARIQQTVAALSGTGFLIGLISIYLLSLIDPENPQAELAALYLLLFLWSLAVDANIYRHALSSRIGVGGMVAVAVYTVNYILLRALFG